MGSQTPPRAAVTDLPTTPADAIARLEEAGATLLALRLGRLGPAQMASAMPEYVRDAAESYGWSGVQVRPAIPDAATISRADEALAWISLIPADRYVLRRIVGVRALVSPVNQRHLYGWTAVARLIGADPVATRQWHQAGIALILLALRRKNTLDIRGLSAPQILAHCRRAARRASAAA